MNTQRIRVNIIPDGRIPPFFVSEGDHGEGLFECEIYKGLTAYNIPENYTIMVNQRRPDGHEVIGYAAYSGNVITINCTTSMTDVAGYSLCELRFIDTDGNAFATSNFAICVKSSAVDDSTRHNSDYNILYLIEDSLNQKEAAIKECSEIAQKEIDTMLTAEANAKSSETAAANSAIAAKASRNAAAQSEANAKVSEQAALTSEGNAKASEGAALTSETNAKASETAAATSASAASASASSAKQSAIDASGYAGAALYSIGINPETGHMAVFYNKENS